MVGVKRESKYYYIWRGIVQKKVHVLCMVDSLQHSLQSLHIHEGGDYEFIITAFCSEIVNSCWWCMLSKLCVRFSDETYYCHRYYSRLSVIVL